MGKAKEEIEKLLKRAGEVDASEYFLSGEDNNGSIPDEIKDREYRLKKLGEAKKQLEKEKLNKVNATDTRCPINARFKEGNSARGYNGQMGVNAKEQVMVAADVL